MWHNFWMAFSSGNNLKLINKRVPTDEWITMCQEGWMLLSKWFLWTTFRSFHLTRDLWPNLLEENITVYKQITVALMYEINTIQPQLFQSRKYGNNTALFTALLLNAHLHGVDQKNQTSLCDGWGTCVVQMEAEVHRGVESSMWQAMDWMCPPPTSTDI